LTHFPSSSLPVVVIGGGAAGFFAAIACAEANRDQPVILLEQGRAPLAKVKISGGGRCNVTHACFDPKELVKHYPRGGKALLGPFHTFQPRNTVAWFEQRGVPLKTEEDGRMFPTTDFSQTIIDALVRAAREAGVTVRTEAEVAAGGAGGIWQPNWGTPSSRRFPRCSRSTFPISGCAVSKEFPCRRFVLPWRDQI
jgi:predicted Rossmann fold flavoprotein